MDREIFRKTAAGVAEVRTRQLGLDARTRGLLILVNGERTVAELAAHMGHDPSRTIISLVGAGLLEQSATAPPPRARPAPATPPAPPAPPLPKPAAPPPAGPAELLPDDLAAARQRAHSELAPHYGPDAERMSEPLRRAATVEEFAAAAATLRETLSVHMGRKLADKLARRIAQGA